ncbi:hypothetical protein N752_22645 [Desulforamulus aquiferis]|nr:hypothetical protein [Desulforamulus aquiferis]RYD02816.1 hypothetical protein N752_22645 [Desulforamulus aquiferis]
MVEAVRNKFPDIKLMADANSAIPWPIPNALANWIGLI